MRAGLRDVLKLTSLTSRWRSDSLAGCGRAPRTLPHAALLRPRLYIVVLEMESTSVIRTVGTDDAEFLGTVLKLRDSASYHILATLFPRDCIIRSFLIVIGETRLEHRSLPSVATRTVHFLNGFLVTSRRKTNLCDEGKHNKRYERSTGPLGYKQLHLHDVSCTCVRFSFYLQDFQDRLSNPLL